ncbi:Di-copper centre-containing protein, partial [Neoconidiobolus thromboides FSU 785]
MHFITTLILLCIYTISHISSQCNQIVRRPEIRELSATQVRRFTSAIQQLRNQGGLDIYEQLSGYHYNFAENAHGVPAFFPWHREFLRRFELELQKIDSSIILPYWDWSMDSQSPERSIIFRNDYFGGNGRDGDNCVANGPFTGWNVNVPNVHCLKRDFDNNSTISSFYSPEALELIFMQSTNYDSFRQTIEGSPHAVVHVGIGGDVGDLTNMFSSNDPLFFLHHVFIDRLWFEWQQRYPNLAKTYNG